MLVDEQGFKVWTEEEKALVAARLDALLGKLDARIFDRKVQETITRLKLSQAGDVTQPEIQTP